MNINGVDVVKKLERYNESLELIALHRKCAKHFIEVHYYIHNNICMLDYPPESLFDDFILQEDNECLLERHNESLELIALHRKCAKHFIEVHYYIHDHICMLDYPPESMFDDFILQEENKCLLERTEDETLEIEAIDKIAPKIKEARDLFDRGYIEKTPLAFVGGYDKDNGYTCANYSQNPPKQINKKLQAHIDKKIEEGKINNIGEKGKETKNIVGRCAEVHVVNDILNNSDNSNIETIRLTRPMRLKKDFKNPKYLQEDVLTHWKKALKDNGCREIHYCPNCESMFAGTDILKKEFI